jgi:hypothetical protein
MSFYRSFSRESALRLSEPAAPRPVGTEKWKVVAGMATHAPRVATLGPTVASLARQVDELHIYLNEYDKVPSGVPRYENVTYYCGVNLGTLGRLGFQREADLYCVVDDDLIYPPDYVAAHLAAHLRHSRAVTCFHASLLKEEYQSYLSSRVVLSAFEELAEDTRVHVAALGTVAWKPTDVVVPLGVAGRTVQVDVPTSIFLREEGMNLWCLAHSAGWIRPSPGVDQSVSIFKRTHADSSPIDSDVLRSGLHLSEP